MKQAVLAPALLAAAGLAFGQAAEPPKVAPVTVAKPKCDPKPDYPGRLAMQSDLRRNSFNRELAAYKTCMMSYVEERKATYAGNLAAANDAIAEYNETMKKIAADQEAAKGP